MNLQGFCQANQTIHDAATHAGDAFLLVKSARMQGKEIKREVMAPSSTAVGQTDRPFMIFVRRGRNQNEGHLTMSVFNNRLTQTGKAFCRFSSLRIVTPPLGREAGKLNCVTDNP